MKSQFFRKKYKRSYKSIWTKQEDTILLKKAKEYNYRNWKQISSHIPNRDSVQCLSRFKRIRPGLKKGSWSQQEDIKVMKLIDKYGKNWSKLSKNLKNRTR